MTRGGGGPEGEPGAGPGEGTRPSPESGASKAQARPNGATAAGARRSNQVVGAITIASAVAGALAHAHPTGTTGVDEAYGAIFAAVITLAAAYARRGALLYAATIGAALSRDLMLIPAGAALAAAFATTLQRRSHRRVNALIGALVTQSLLRWGHLGFQGFTALAAAAAVIPVLVSAERRLPRQVSRRIVRSAAAVVGLAVLASIPVVLSALLAKTPASQGITEAEAGLKQVEAGQAPGATGQLKASAANLAKAHSRVDGWWNAPAYLVPVVAQQVRALTGATSAGAQLTATAADVAPTLDLQSLEYQHGRIDLTAMRRLQAPLGQLSGAIDAAAARIAGGRSPWLVAPVADRYTKLQAQVAKASSGISLATEALQEGPDLLGGNGVRHYLVIFTSPAETRGLGGFIGAYGLLTVDNGAITLGASGPADSINKAYPDAQLVAPADYAARYARFNPQLHFVDLSYSPDFPSDEAAVAGMYPQLGGQPIDGVLDLDPYALAALLQITGPVTVAGLDQPLTAANAVDTLLRTQYLTYTATPERHDLLQDALAAGFARFTSGSFPSPKALGDALGPSVHQGRLLFWSSHAADQPLLRRLGLDGSFPAVPYNSDLLAVTVDNAANNKIDAYLHQSVTDQVAYDPSSGHVHSVVTINLQNAAPGSGLPAYVIGSYSGSGLPAGTNLAWLSLYSPLPVTGATQDGRPIAFAPPVTEDGTPANSTFIQIAPQATTTITVDLDGYLAPGPLYSLVTRLQPLANSQALSVSVTRQANASGLEPAPVTWTAGTNEVEGHSWRFGP